MIDSLVSSEWLSLHVDDADLVVLDCTVRIEADGAGGMRTVSGRAAFEAGHIPGAGFADLITDLSDTTKPIGFAVPSAEAFCAAMGALGVGDDSSVVLYDNSGSMWAARVWWMLRWVGFDRAALLDGGQSAWKAAGHPLADDHQARASGVLTPRPRPELIADRDEVLAAIGDPGVEIIDALFVDHYRGDMAMYARPGHISGASNLPVFDLFDESGRFRPIDELATMHEGDRSGRKITYCGGGIAASANAFVMTRLGFDDVAVYTASLQEWTADPDNPMSVGDQPS